MLPNVDNNKYEILFPIDIHSIKAYCKIEKLVCVLKTAYNANISHLVRI